METIVIVGGKLQGTEAAYLGKEAGFNIILIDKNQKAPAKNLCSKFICADVLSSDVDVIDALESADMILPTMENEAVLEGLVRLSKDRGYTLAFDWDAYKISSSKKKSDKLFADNNLPCPKYYPEGNFPYFAKPDSESGSHGVRYLENKFDVEKLIYSNEDGYIIQEFIEGPSYSVEVIGKPGNYRTYEITEIFVDDVYDCNYAATLHTIEPRLKKKIEELAVEIAELINLKGIMDLEVIDFHGEIKILEIDARLPSQTSIVVYHASGMNYIKELYDLFCNGEFKSPQSNAGRCASMIHYLFSKGQITTHGERIMVEGGELNYTENIHVESTVISDFRPGISTWRGTFINWASDENSLRKKEEQMKRKLDEQFG